MKIRIWMIFMAICATGFGQDSLKEMAYPIRLDSSFFKRQFRNPDLSLTAYPKNDGFTYNQFVGETIAGFSLAEGWREDTINGGFNKQVYVNPYMSYGGLRFEKQSFGRNMIFYRYDKGRRVDGQVKDTLTLRYSQKVGNNKLIYQSKDVKVVFEATCVNGTLHGVGMLKTLDSSQIVAECNFMKGELVGDCKSWDLYTKLETIVTYVKGEVNWVKYVELDEDGNILSSREK